ncbi:MAG: hybrid sensor histidine kinase/response regulator [Rubrivivax sp.]|nr:hybrid sensor histidine kinase/response regulator [Rubrivivax sp.]
MQDSSPLAAARVLSAAERTGFDERRLQVLVDYSAALRWQMLATAAVIGGLCWAGGSAPLWVVLWLAATVAAREVRAAALLRLRDATRTPVAVRLRATTGWTLLLGAAFGAVGFFMRRLDTAYDAILTMILLSLSAGAVSTTFTVVPAFVAFAGAISLPVVLMWLANGDWLDLGIGLLVLLFMGVQVRYARQNMRMFEESYRMRLDNLDLLRQLSNERTRLAQARDLAVRTDLSKSRFLAAASHDLRQPLQSLSLNIGALQRLVPAGDCHDIADEIAEGTDTLRRMLDALLDISMLESGSVAPHLQAVALDRFVHAVCARMRPAAEARGLRLDGDCPPGLVVHSDPEMLRRVVSNLVDNALKFTTRGGVALDVQADGERVALRVRDTGCGIAPADQARVFEDFEQLHNPARSREHGHGLGLGIVRRLSRLLGIELRLQSTPGVGSSFELLLPVAERAQPLLGDGDVIQPGLVARRVLVLDDDEAVRSAYRHALEGLGCHVACAATLAEAVALLPTTQPEVALVDFRLAGADDGLGAIAALRQRQPALPAVLVTADTLTELYEQALALGVPVLRKPVTAVALAIAVNKVLNAPGDGH